ncbi:MAG: glycosyltransferase family 9 protein, partial [Caulobacteraceae bacterium]
VAEPVRASVPRSRLIDLVGREGLLTCYAALKHARLFIGNDSGLMHLAAAAGAPTLGLFGPSNEALYAPWGPLSRVARGPRSVGELREADPLFNQEICHMMDLPASSVLARAEALIEDSAAAFVCRT